MGARTLHPFSWLLKGWKGCCVFLVMCSECFTPNISISHTTTCPYVLLHTCIACLASPCKQQQFHFHFSVPWVPPHSSLHSRLCVSPADCAHLVGGVYLSSSHWWTYMRSITGGIGKYTNHGFTIATLYHSYPCSMLACHLRLEVRPKYQGMIVNFGFGNGIGSRYTPDDMFLLLCLLGSTPGWGWMQFFKF